RSGLAARRLGPAIASPVVAFAATLPVSGFLSGGLAAGGGMTATGPTAALVVLPRSPGVRLPPAPVRTAAVRQAPSPPPGPAPPLPTMSPSWLPPRSSRGPVMAFQPAEQKMRLHLLRWREPAGQRTRPSAVRDGSARLPPLPLQ